MFLKSLIILEDMFSFGKIVEELECSAKMSTNNKVGKKMTEVTIAIVNLVIFIYVILFIGDRLNTQCYKDIETIFDSTIRALLKDYHIQLLGAFYPN